MTYIIEPNSVRYKVQQANYQIQVNEGRAILPRSALYSSKKFCNKLHYHEGPLIFRIYNQISGRTSHTAAQSFTADEGNIILPQCMIENLGIENNEELIVQRACLPYATYCKLESYDTETTSLKDQKHLLKSTLTRLCCLTVGDKLKITDQSGQVFKIAVIMTKPEDAVKILSCNVQDLEASIINEPMAPTYNRNEFVIEATFIRDVTPTELPDKKNEIDMIKEKTETSPDVPTKGRKGSKLSFKGTKRSSKSKNKPRSQNQKQTYNEPKIFLNECYITRIILSKMGSKKVDKDPENVSEEPEEQYKPQQKKYITKPLDYDYINRKENIRKFEDHEQFNPDRFDNPRDSFYKINKKKIITLKNQEENYIKHKKIEDENFVAKL